MTPATSTSTSSGSSVVSIARVPLAPAAGGSAVQCTLIAAALVVQRLGEESRRPEGIVFEAKPLIDAARSRVVVPHFERELAATPASRMVLHGLDQGRSDALPLVSGKDREIVNVQQRARAKRRHPEEANGDSDRLVVDERQQDQRRRMFSQHRN